MSTGSNRGRHSYANRSSGSNQSGARFNASLNNANIAQLTLPEGLDHLPPTPATHSPVGSIGSNRNAAVPGIGPLASHSTPATPDATTSAGPSRDKRKHLDTVGKHLEPSEPVKNCMLNIYRDDFPEGVYKWGKLDKSTKDRYWEEFKKKFVWDQGNERQVRRAWASQAAGKYRQLISKMKIGHVKPECIKDEEWNKLLRCWDDPVTIAESDINKANQDKGERVTWYGGSISTSSHQDRLRKAGQSYGPFDVFTHTHTKSNDGVTFSSQKASAVKDKYQELMAERSQPLPGTQDSRPVDEYDVYYDAIGGLIHGRLYGLGDSASTFYGATATSSTARSHAPSSNLQARLEEQEETIRTMREENASMRAENARRDTETTALRAENAKRDAETAALRAENARCDGETVALR